MRRACASREWKATSIHIRVKCGGETGCPCLDPPSLKDSTLTNPALVNPPVVERAGNEAGVLDPHALKVSKLSTGKSGHSNLRPPLGNIQRQERTPTVIGVAMHRHRNPVVQPAGILDFDRIAFGIDKRVSQRREVRAGPQYFLALGLDLIGQESRLSGEVLRGVVQRCAE
jgi:hypothetical protein